MKVITIYKGCYNIKKTKINAYIMAIFIFQFGISQPIASLLNTQIPVAISTLILLIVMLVNNYLQIKRFVILSFLLLSLFFLLNGLFLSESLWFTITLYITFILTGFSGFIFGSLDTDGNDLYNAFLKMAVINFIIIGSDPFIGYLDSMNYMRFGYAMIPSVIMFWYAIFDKGNYKLLWCFMALFATLTTIIYGSRGIILVMFLLIVFLYFFNNNISKIKKILIFLVSSTFLFLIIKYKLVVKLIDFLFLEIEIKSYSLEKLRMMFNDGLAESSSGRYELYSTLWFYIKQSPLKGYGIGFSERNIGLFSHNIFLQILIESGIIALFIWISIWVFCINKYMIMSKSQENKFFKITSLLLSISFGRLLVSSDIWLRPEYWFLLSMLINFKIKDKNIREVK